MGVRIDTDAVGAVEHNGFCGVQVQVSPGA